MQFSWKNLKPPVFILAPMEDVTDCAFREMFAKYGKPDLLFTEFVSIDGLMNPEGRKKLSVDLLYTEIQRPIIGQIWGTDPEKFYACAQYLAELGFDGIDINMGCPQTKEIAVGACAALIREPKKAQAIIRATQKGAGSLPVSVKTRLGYSKTDELENWLLHLLETGLPALTLHARTKKEMSKVPAHWDKIAEAVNIRDREKSTTLIIGNGDVKSRTEALERVAETKADGIMIGRGAFGNPWLFREDALEISIEERFRVMLEHAELFETMYLGIKPFQTMRKHFKAYCSGFPGAAELRAKLMETQNVQETKTIITEYLAGNAA